MHYFPKLKLPLLKFQISRDPNKFFIYLNALKPKKNLKLILKNCRSYEHKFTAWNSSFQTVKKINGYEARFFKLPAKI